jgi:hypothetical protein
VTDQLIPPSASSVSSERTFPTRFRAGGARNERMGRPLKVIARVKKVDEELLARIGRAMFERDELAARLAEAIRLRAGEPGRVTKAQLSQALEWGVASVPDAPPALVAFFAEVEPEPAWLDRDRLDTGARFFRRMGRNASDVLTQLSLIGGYRFGGPTDLLVATGGLTGPATLRRLAETQKWGVALAGQDALVPPLDGRPSGEAWRLTVHVRLMHAMVNQAFEPTWDIDQWGLPINQADQASTLGLFDGVLLLGCRALGVPISKRESRDLMHLWKYVGHLMGVAPEFLVDDEWTRHRLDYHVVLAQGGITDAGPRLAQAVVEAQAGRVYPRWPAALQRARARFEHERLLSMLTVFLGVASMRELGLPVRPPWAFAYLIPLNTLRYRVFGRTARGKRRLEERGARYSQEILDSYFVGGTEGIGELRS